MKVIVFANENGFNTLKLALANLKSSSLEKKWWGEISETVFSLTELANCQRKRMLIAANWPQNILIHMHS